MADDVPLAFYLSAGLFLKPEARIRIEVKLPLIKTVGTSVSNWEVMEKTKTLSSPEEYTSLRVVNYSRELIHFEGELESVRAMRKVCLLLNGKSMKLSGFSELLRIKAEQLQPPHPTRGQWEEFFEARGTSVFEEGRPGERADTLRVRGLPVKWFISKDSSGRPCLKMLASAFQKFGIVRQVGIYDPSSSSSSLSANEGEPFASFGPGSGSRAYHFEAYIQYEKYTGFVNAVNSLKGMCMLRLEEGGKESIARLSVDFDRTAFLSERNVRRRLHEEERRRKVVEEQEKRELEKKEEEERKQREEEQRKEEEEAQRRAKKQEEKRKRKQEQAEVVAELKVVAVKRREEAQRLLRVLLAGAAEERYQQEEAERREREAERREKEERREREEKERKRRKQLREEAELKEKLIKDVRHLERKRSDLQRKLKRTSSSSDTSTHLHSSQSSRKHQRR